MNSEERAADTALRNDTDTDGYKMRSMRIDADRWERMRVAARADGRSISGWIRMIVDRVLKKT